MNSFFRLNLRWLVTVLTLCLMPASALAFDTLGSQAVNEGTPFYDPNATGDCTTGVTAPIGNLPASVPAPYNGIFTQAAQATGVDPILLASIYYTENRGFEPNPPAPYGTGNPQDFYGPSQPWSFSGAPPDATWPNANPVGLRGVGARGPFQFEPGTWQTNGGGGNVDDLKDAANGGGRLLVALGGKNGIPQGDETNPDLVKPSVAYVLAAYNAGPDGNFNNPQTIQYVQIGLAIYNKLSGGTTAAASGGTAALCSDSASPINGSVVSIAEGQIGTHEWTTETDSTPGACNCGGGIQPDGHTVDSYTNNAGTYYDDDHPGEDWCADFVSWVYMKAGQPFSGGEGTSWKVPAAISIVDYMKAHGTWIPNGPNANPSPGMIIYFNFTDNGATGGSNDHIGIVDHVSGNTLYDIEGNAANQVLAVTYPNFRSNPTIIGFGGLNQ
jgi:hypothetical protein